MITTETIEATHNKGPSASQSATDTAPDAFALKSLCAPTGDLSCFGCCPPIRPAGYDPVRYVSSLRREFRDNRRDFLDRPSSAPRPIVGYHCWALGYLDRAGHRVGCLLHPYQNAGNDLRYLTDFARVCAGEQCFPARTFAALPTQGRRFWLPLGAGLSPFYYSSRRANPLFHILRWGRDLLERLRTEAIEAGWSATELLWHFPALTDPVWRPRAHRYLLRKAWARAAMTPEPIRWSDAAAKAEQVMAKLKRHRCVCAPRHNGTAPKFVHQLPIPTDLADFLRLGLGWRQRVGLPDATRIDQLISELLNS